MNGGRGIAPPELLGPHAAHDCAVPPAGAPTALARQLRVGRGPGPGAGTRAMAAAPPLAGAGRGHMLKRPGGRLQLPLPLPHNW